MSDLTVADLEKKFIKEYGEGIGGQDTPMVDVERIPTGFFPFDLAYGGGLPKGRTTTIYGPESCLDRNTLVPYAVQSPRGKRRNYNGETIKQLHDRFHSVTRNAPDTTFMADCLNEEGRIFRNRIVDVVPCGEKPCFRLRTVSGLEIVATEKHKFYNGHAYVPLSQLMPGAPVMVRADQPHRAFDPEARLEMHYFYVVAHGVAKRQSITRSLCGETRTYVFHRLLCGRAVIEAEMNGLSLPDYLARLNSCNLTGLTFLTEQQHVHHRNEDALDYQRSNLVVVDLVAQGALHALRRHDTPRFVAVDDAVASIEPVGNRETYDIRMEAPFNNYVAAGFVVHNSGKTNLALRAIASHQLLWPKEECVFFDVENSYDPAWATTLGVDNKKLRNYQPDYAEQAVDMVVALINTKDIGLIVIDSLAALVGTQELESSAEDNLYGGSSLVVKKLVNKSTVALSKAKKEGRYPTLIYINQTRVNIVGLAKNKYADPEKMPGGNSHKFQAALILRTYGKDLADPKINQLVPYAKHTSVICKKNKVPIFAKHAEYEMFTLPVKGFEIGDCDDWNTIQAHLENLGQFTKTPGGYMMLGTVYPTIKAARMRVQTDKEYGHLVRRAIIEETMAQAKSSGKLPMVDFNDAADDG